MHTTLPAKLFMQQEILTFRSKADYISRVAQDKEEGLQKLAQKA